MMPSAGTTYADWSADDARTHIAVPREDDDKYSRGVLGVITGSADYPGAAILGVEAALHTGLGMVRYLGPKRPSTLVLQRRPEAVTANGRVQAWLLGSGMDASTRGSQTAARLETALKQGLPMVIDAGALDLLGTATGPVVITPHFRELAKLVDATAEQIGANPAAWAVRAAEQLGATVLLKGHNTYIAAPDGTRIVTSTAPAWVATAGAGDALGGILGALVATHSAEIGEDSGLLARLAATASTLHGLAAAKASAGGPLTVLDLVSELPSVIAGLLIGRP
jgi:hydroxyethylthiazole kinase-like uncharacterized protein yjeF